MAPHARVRLRMLPLKSYAMELICAVALQTARDPFEPACYLEGVCRSLQGLTDGWPALPVGWERYFAHEAVTARPSAGGVLVVDPADPSTNALANLSADEASALRWEASRAVPSLRDARCSQLKRRSSRFTGLLISGGNGV